MVATTGVAGYGVALSSPRPLPGNGSSSLFWEVCAKAFGVGGFAVGVCDAAWKGPFKSLGRASGSAVLGGAYHSSGFLLTSAHPTVDKKLASSSSSTFGPEFEPGDKIGVLVQLAVSAEAGKKQKQKKQSSTAAITVSFFLNGKIVGSVVESAASPTLVSGGGSKSSGGGLALAVQPYMGGVAHLLLTAASSPY